MNTLVDRIAEVLRAHHFRPVEDHWQCTAQDCTGKWLSSSSEAAHVAERVAAALQLTEENQWVPIAKDGSRWSPRSQQAAQDALESFCPDDVGDSWKLVSVEPERRWVSGWTTAEDRQ